MESNKTDILEDQVSQETLQHFNKVCQQAHQLMLEYKEQSQQLKNQITGMVNVYNQNSGVENAIPLNQIVNITSDYQKGMLDAQRQYNMLSQELKQQEQERSNMVQEITQCFKKLEKLQETIKKRNLLKLEQNQTIQNSNQEK